MVVESLELTAVSGEFESAQDASVPFQIEDVPDGSGVGEALVEIVLDEDCEICAFVIRSKELSVVCWVD